MQCAGICTARPGILLIGIAAAIITVVIANALAWLLGVALPMAVVGGIAGGVAAVAAMNYAARTQRVPRGDDAGV